MNKLGLYWSYSTRSLARGGQRTLLAIFCVAVGVMAIVGLQLVGNTINSALTTNVRAGNGADVSVRSDIAPLRESQLSVFDQLKSKGTITDYTPVSATSATSSVAGSTVFYNLRAVDPTRYPLQGAPIFTSPSGGSLSSLLQGETVVVTESLRAQLNAKVGDTLRVDSSDGRVVNAKIGGVIATKGFFNGRYMLISLDVYKNIESSSGLPVSYSSVYVNVPGDTNANADTAKRAIEDQLPLATVTTTQDAIQQQKDQVQNIRYFLQIVGLLALLIGGIGIINTMQVLLSRRRTEIAMLKTTGYRQADLFALFGLEAGLIGLLGGVVGSLVGIGVSFLIQGIVERLFLIQLPTELDPLTVLAGVAIGFFTALIFGLLPIVQASQIRPIAVLRDLSENVQAGSAALTAALIVLLVALFFALALTILQNVTLTVIVMLGTALFLGILSGVFTLIVLVVSRFPVPERFNPLYAALTVIGLGAAAALTFVAPGFGVLVLVLALLAAIALFLPREAKSNTRMALRNIGRQKSRTVTTLVALFVGVFAIGLILALSQLVQGSINSALLSQQDYNSFIFAGPQTKAALDQQLQQTSGVQGELVTVFAQGQPVGVNGQPIGPLVAGLPSGFAPGQKQGVINALSSVQGYSLSNGQPQDTPNVQLIAGAQDGGQVGRNLGLGDANTQHVVVSQELSRAPLNLKLGDSITLLGQGANAPTTFTIVGFYTTGSGLNTKGVFASILSDASAASALTGGKAFYLYQLKLNPAKADDQLKALQNAVPGIQTFSFAQLTKTVDDLLNDLTVMITAIASLAMIAGVIIIANAVALAMLERRRELGILKSVGYTSGSVLDEVLIENGLIGFLGGLLAMALVAVATILLDKLLLKSGFGIQPSLVLAIVAAITVVAMLVSAAVAWGATRVRPLEVLRYE